MSTPIQSTTGVSPPPAAPAQGSAAPQAPATSVMVDVSKAGAAPIYVYRVTETATGRTLVEIPSQQPARDADAPGRRLDAKV